MSVLADMEKHVAIVQGLKSDLNEVLIAAREGLVSIPTPGDAWSGEIVTYNGATWQCTSQHIKSIVYKPKAGSSKWQQI